MTPLEQQLHDDYTFSEPCVVENLPDAHLVWFKVGAQSFCVSPNCCENAEHAEWFRIMLARALAKMVQNVMLSVK